MSRYLFLFLLLNTFCTSLAGQQDPFFMPFEGDVYKIPAKDVMNGAFGYSDNIYEYEKIGTISWQEIKIPESETSTPFPDVDRLDQLAMVLHSEMIIKETGCYAFILSSDDGSRFWIGDREIINNDGTHKMTAKMDTLHLTQGKYPVKLWYYQGFKNKYGFIFNSTYLDQSDCEHIEEQSPELFSTTSDNKTLQLQSHLLFDYDSAEIKTSALLKLDSIATMIKNGSGSTITITGYTCNKGSAAHNSALSQKRARTIRDILMSKINRLGIVYRAVGLSDQNPIASNESEEGREKNRRVEIKIE